MMTTERKQQILRRAVQKARENGFSHFVGESEEDSEKALALLEDTRINAFFDRCDCWAIIFFDNCFCRAFWGTTYVVPIGKVWKYHQDTMLHSKEPFGYIERYL